MCPEMKDTQLTANPSLLPVDDAPLNEIFTAITDAVISLDENLKINYCNPGARKFFNLKPLDIPGFPIGLLFNNPSYRGFLSMLEDALAQQARTNVLEYCPHQSTLLDVTIYPKSNGLILIIKSAGAHQQVENTLLQELEHQDVLIQNTNDLMWSLDENLRLVSFNRNFRLLVENIFPRQIKSGDSFKEMLGNTTLYDKWMKYLHKALEGRKLRFDQQEVGEGATGYYEVTLEPVRDIISGKVNGIACHAYDISARKRSERLIKEQNIKLREKQKSLRHLSGELQTILDASLDIICSINNKGVFTRVNQASKNLLGYEPKELLGKQFAEIVQPGNIQEAKDILVKIVRGVEVTDFKCFLNSKTGNPVPFIWSARWDEAEQMIFAIGRDASAMYEAEMLRTESETRFSALIQKGADMIAIIDEVGTYKYLSPNVERILGYSPAELMGKNAFAFIHQDDLQVVLEEFNHVMDHSEVSVGDFRFKNGKDEWRWVEVIGTNMLHNDVIKGIVINSRDITERKKAEEALRASNERFEIVSKATNEAIWDFDIVNGVMRWNDNYTKLFGYEVLEENDLSSWRNRIHPDDAERVWDEVERMLHVQGNKSWRSEYRYQQACGGYSYVYDQGYIIVDGENKPVRFVGAMQDFTERKKIEEEREVIIKELVRTNNDLKQFSFITSHNLRAPLSNILGILQLIDRTNIDEVNNQLLDLINTSSLQLQETIKDLSDIIVIKNHVDINHELLNIETTFDNVRKIYLNTLKDVKNCVQVDFSVKEVYLHKPYIESIFINLISNAVKYRSEKRPLQINIQTYENEQGELVMRFADNGIGLDTLRLKDRLFGLYQRFHDHTEGKGLGLFIVKSQVTALGGIIEIDSEQDKGTTFTIKLPIKKI